MELTRTQSSCSTKRDSFLEYDHKTNPAYADIALQHMNVMADIAAAIHEHNAGNITHSYQPATLGVLVGATTTSTFSSWVENLKIYAFIILLVFCALFLFRLCFVCGFCDIIWKLCCRLPKKSGGETGSS